MKQRVISAVVLIAVSFTCVLLSPITRVLFFAAAGIACAYELSRGLERLGAACGAWVMYAYIGVQALLALFHMGFVYYVFCFTVSVFLALFYGIVNSKSGGLGAIYTVAGLAYPSFLFGLLMMISVGEIWAQTLVLACFSTWVCDSFALFGGMRFGKHKLAPLVSPNKTVEGSVCGDLAESLIKRLVGLKDFSNLIPGHGGMFDRADSLLFSIPTAYLCLHLAGLGV